MRVFAYSLSATWIVVGVVLFIISSVWGTRLADEPLLSEVRREIVATAIFFGALLTLVSCTIAAAIALLANLHDDSR